jgi:hypothetical protein
MTRNATVAARKLPVVDRLETASGVLIVVGSKSNKLVRTVLEQRPADNDRLAVTGVRDLGPEQYLLADSLWKAASTRRWSK